MIREDHTGGKICLVIGHAELAGCECSNFTGSSLWLQDSEGFVVAAPGPSQCSRPQVSVGRLPLKQDSAQVPRCGCKQHGELSNKTFFFFRRAKSSVHASILGWSGLGGLFINMGFNC